MKGLAGAIRREVVEPGSLSIFWLCQAGFAFRAHRGQIVYVDPYLSDVVERVYGFKRMMACPILAREVTADLIICTHEHEDHMDIDALPIIAKKPRTHFAGPIECVKQFKKMGIPADRCHLLESGKEIDLKGIRIKAVYADHGELAPDAVGIILDFDGIKVYHTGDTAYRPEMFKPAVEARPHILLPCINGRFGNLNAEQAALLVRDTRPRVAIASHFWMFVEHNGDPGAFLEKCSELAPGVQALIMKPGEEYVFKEEKRYG